MKMQKRLASKILKVGASRIIVQPDKTKDIKEAITRDDVKLLIKKGIISVKPKKGVSRARAKKIHSQKKKGRKKGAGMKIGRKTARNPSKRAWINKIRPQRALLKVLKEGKKVSNEQFRKLYGLAKAGFFRSTRHLKIYVSKMKGEKVNE